MAPFTALNIEPDDQSDDEVDNTKELQIEEALKLYQNALRLHSQGPEAFPQAAEAYGLLFKSDIFSYPESISEFTRFDENNELQQLEVPYPLELDLAATGAEATPSTLPQILYLSFKNHGQFILDCVRDREKVALTGTVPRMNKDELKYNAKAAIDNFALALAKDESDTELWRRAARVASTLGSTRISRYCLEAAVEVDDDPTVAEVEPASLEEGFAGVQLKGQLEVLSDEASLSHPIMAPFLKKNMPAFVLKHVDPYSYLPNNTSELKGPFSMVNGLELPEFPLDIPEWSWTALGDALCAVYFSQHASGVRTVLNFPPGGPKLTSIEPPSLPLVEDQIMEDAEEPEARIMGNESPPDVPSVSVADEEATQPNTSISVVPLNDETETTTTILPSRKRSHSIAGIRDTPEDDSGAQKRSKRIRNRDATSEVDPKAQFTEQLQNSVRADEDVFAFVGSTLAKLGVTHLGTFSEFQSALTSENGEDRDDLLTNMALRDLRDVLRSWDDKKSSTFVNGNAADILGSSAGGANAGLASFLENTKMDFAKITSKPVLGVSEDLTMFADKIAKEWLPLRDIIFEWLSVLIGTYREKLWPDDLKGCFMRIISYVDGDIFERIQEDVNRILKFQGGIDVSRHCEMVQTLFELHLDLYVRITNPNSIVSFEMRTISKDRLDRWADLAATLMKTHSGDSTDELSLRYLWASVFYATTVGDVAREHKVLCWTDLRDLIIDGGSPVIELQNNAVMPEISAAAAEEEVSRLTTMDFFHTLFHDDVSNPTDIIATLEPVLDPESALLKDVEGTLPDSETLDNTPAALRDMWKFLSTGSTSLRLFLWQRLREAYAKIDYNTKVFSCYLKSIEVIVADLGSERYIDSAEESRKHQLLLWLKALDDLLVRALTIALNDSSTCFEIIDERHLKSTCSAIAQLNRVLHSAAIFDDEIRVGMSQLPPNPEYGPHGSFSGFIGKLREMQVRTWALQYTMVKEATHQSPETFTTPDKDLADFLALVHYCLGLRKCCKSSNKIFLKMMKVEMIRLKQVDRWEDYLGQVLFDLYGIRLGVGTYLLEDHGCSPEQLDRRTVLNIAEQVIVLANRMPLKDLLKHELRSTIERMQTAIGPAKPTPQMQHNLRNLTEYLKTSIQPIRMYKAAKGNWTIDSIPVVSQDSSLAENGWYFLQGMIALTKFRSQKKLGPSGQTDDMKVSATFMRLQLQYNSDHWETWYRLAQCFDYELEDEVMWTADNINNHQANLVRLQRGAIHCYIMALSTSRRKSHDDAETMSKLSEMYYDFGMRIYASSREPFNHEAFYVDGFEKHMSGNQGMYKQALHQELSRPAAWKYAATLFTQAANSKPDNWMNHYMLGKCLWKLYSRSSPDNDMTPQNRAPLMATLIRRLVRAVKTVPRPRDSRQEPILEPHYKIIAITHKLVILDHLKVQEAADLLQEQPFAVRKGEKVTITNNDEWKAFVLESLNFLRAQDKQHWQHRMVSRVATILYDGDLDHTQAAAARHEFRESIFTKTMHIQVWKPEAERPARHCVYMTRYVRFMFNLLHILDDRANMEALSKRVRKKANDFYRFSEVWTDCCTHYLRMIRQAGQIPPSSEDMFKNVSQDEYEDIAQRMENWIDDSTNTHPALDALREAIDLKKINANQMKPIPIDDVINDAWAVLFFQVGKNLPRPEIPSLEHAQMDGTPPEPRVVGPMSLNNLVMDMAGQQVPVPIPIAPADNRARKVGIARREITRRAEAAVLRVPEPPRTALPLLAPSTLPGSSSAPIAERSAPGSVDDDADDESDLSDVPDMDDVEAANMFPNLVRRITDGAGSSNGETGTTPKEG